MRTPRPKTIRARELRRDATEAEKALWRALRESDLPFRFRRQHPIGPYIADFACPPRKLVIEIDGGQHADNAEGDARRTEALKRYGYCHVLRFWNHDVLGNVEGVMAIIRTALEEPTSS